MPKKLLHKQLKKKIALNHPLKITINLTLETSPKSKTAAQISTLATRIVCLVTFSFQQSLSSFNTDQFLFHYFFCQTDGMAAISSAVFNGNINFSEIVHMSGWLYIFKSRLNVNASNAKVFCNVVFKLLLFIV